MSNPFKLIEFNFPSTILSGIMQERELRETGLEQCIKKTVKRAYLKAAYHKEINRIELKNNKLK